jgi:hypothetical protein
MEKYMGEYKMETDKSLMELLYICQNRIRKELKLEKTDYYNKYDGSGNIVTFVIDKENKELIKEINKKIKRLNK